MLFIDRTSGGYIDLVGETYFGITRRPGIKARCAVTPDRETPVPLVPYQTSFPHRHREFVRWMRYPSQREGPAQGTLEGRAAHEGAAYNIGPGSIVSMYVNLRAWRPTPTGEASGGTDTFRERRGTRPASGSGGKAHQRGPMAGEYGLGLEVAGVGDAQGGGVLADGPGTSKGVTVVDSTIHRHRPRSWRRYRGGPGRPAAGWGHRHCGGPGNRRSP